MDCPSLNELPTPPEGKTGWPWTEATMCLADAVTNGQPWPRISIITPSYNQGRFLEETIRSVLLQGYPNLEYIVVDGRSTDNSVEIIRKYEPWLAYWISEPDGGQSHALNKGLLRATGEFVAYQNSDDIYWPEALWRVGEIISGADIDIIFGTADIMDENGKRRPPVCPIPEPNIGSLIRFWKGPANILPSQGFFCRLELLRRIGGYTEKYHYKMDLDVICRLLEVVPRERIARMDEILAGYRIHDSSKTRNMSSHQAVEEGLEISRRYWHRFAGKNSGNIAREARQGKGFMAMCRAGIAAERGEVKMALTELFRAYVNHPCLMVSRANLAILKSICPSVS